jgi:hypothetical protein
LREIPCKLPLIREISPKPHRRNRSSETSGKIPGCSGTRCVSAQISHTQPPEMTGEFKAKLARKPETGVGGGGGGIRTPGGRQPSTVFKTAAFDRSATPPGRGRDSGAGAILKEVSARRITPTRARRLFMPPPLGYTHAKRVGRMWRSGSATGKKRAGQGARHGIRE